MEGTQAWQSESSCKRCDRKVLSYLLYLSYEWKQQRCRADKELQRMATEATGTYVVFSELLLLLLLLSLLMRSLSNKLQFCNCK